MNQKREMKLGCFESLIKMKKSVIKINKKEGKKRSQTGERGETTRWNQSQSLVGDLNGMK